MLSVAMLSVAMLSVVMLNVVMLSVVMLSVNAPNLAICSFITKESPGVVLIKLFTTVI